MCAEDVASKNDVCLKFLLRNSEILQVGKERLERSSHGSLFFLLKLVLFGEFTRDCFSVFSVGLVNVALESKNESLLLRQGDGATNRSKDKTVHFANCSKPTRFQERDPSILSIYLLISTDTLYKHI